jgi:Zn-finger nucleic acid-binding protein
MSDAIAVRLPCPVCLGVNLTKVHVGPERPLVLDYCRRCGGIFFEKGEVQQLRRSKPEALWAEIVERRDAVKMACHNCHTLMDRNEKECAACGWSNTIECPSCARPMKAQTFEGLRLDVCAKCKGVWFDHEELAAIWSLTLEASLVRRRRGAALDSDDSFVLMSALAYSPDVLFYGAHAAGYAIQGAGEALGNAPEAVVAVAEGAGEAASGVFEAIVSIIEGLFS